MATLYCSVNGCKSNSNIANIKFYGFPKEFHESSVWKKVVGRDGWKPRKYSKICSNHFLAKDCGYRLRKGATPVENVTATSALSGRLTEYGFITYKTYCRNCRTCISK